MPDQGSNQGAALGVAMSRPTLDSLVVTCVATVGGLTNSGPVTGTDLTVTGNSLIGDSTHDTVGFYGCVGACQAAVIAAVGTSVPVAACASFGLTSTQLTALITNQNALLVALKALGLISTT